MSMVENGCQSGDGSVSLAKKRKLCGMDTDLLAHMPPGILTKSLKLQHQSIMVNAWLLAKASELFKRLLRLSGRSALVHTPANLNTFEEIVYFAHYNKPRHLSYEKLEFLLTTAVEYESVSLLDFCWTYMKNKVNNDNIWHLMRVAKKAEADLLIEKLHLYACEHFEKLLLEADGDNNLANLDGADLLKLIQDDRLNVKSEEHLLHVVDSWMTHQCLQSRQKWAAPLLQGVRLGFISMDTVEQIENRVWVRNNAEAREQLAKVRRQNCRKSRNLRSLYSSFNKPRSPWESVLVVGGWAGNSPTANCHVFNPRANTWCEPKSLRLPGGRVSFGLVRVGADIFVLGGEVLGEYDSNDDLETRTELDSKCTQSVLRLNLDAEHLAWSERQPMHYKRRDMAAAEMDGCIYVVGGDTSSRDGAGQVLNTAERMNKEQKKWEEIAKCIIPRAAAAASSLDGKLYLVGGYTHTGMEEMIATVECYSAGVNQWTMVSPMMQPRFFLCVLPLPEQNRLLVIGGGGEEEAGSVESYDPTLDTWRMQPSLRRFRADFAAAICDEKLFCLGGGDDTHVTESVELLPLNRNMEAVGDHPPPEWQEGVALPRPVWGHRAVTITGLERIVRLLEDEEVTYLDSSNSSTSSTSSTTSISTREREYLPTTTERERDVSDSERDSEHGSSPDTSMTSSSSESTMLIDDSESEMEEDEIEVDEEDGEANSSGEEY